MPKREKKRATISMSVELIMDSGQTVEDVIKNKTVFLAEPTSFCGGTITKIKINSVRLKK